MRNRHGTPLHILRNPRVPGKAGEENCVMQYKFSERLWGTDNERGM